MSSVNPSLYFPPVGDQWRKVSPEVAGLDAEKLADAAKYAESNETAFWTRAIVTPDGRYDNAVGQQRWNELLGPVKPRGGPSGLVIRHGAIVTEWGDTRRPEMSFSISKNYISLCAAIALQDGLINDLDDTVRSYELDDGFDDPHNQSITWQNLLQQTSEWQGTMWDKPDNAERKIDTNLKSPWGVPTPDRQLKNPGSHWEYNDVRYNRLSLSLLRLFRKPLPEVLKERILGPIGASQDWEWPAYRNAYVEIDGERMPSVPGGGRWGGGIWMSARDHARTGLLVLNRGTWDNRQILQSNIVDRILRPSVANPNYASSWWLNPGQQVFPAAPGNSIFARGGETTVIWVLPDQDMVVVSMWNDAACWNTLFAKIIDATAA